MGDAWRGLSLPRCSICPVPSLPHPCTGPALPAASVSPTEHRWGCQGWQEELGKLDEPSQDLATGAGSIPPLLQARAGHEVQPHMCQGTLGTCHCQPTMGENAPKLSREGQDLSSCHPLHPSAAGAHTTPKAPRILLATA